MRKLLMGSAYILTTGFWLCGGGNLAFAQQVPLADACIGLHVALADPLVLGKSPAASAASAAPLATTAAVATGAGIADLRGSVPVVDAVGPDADARTSAAGAVAPDSSAVDLGPMAGISMGSASPDGNAGTFWKAQIDALEMRIGTGLQGLISVFGDPPGDAAPATIFAGPSYQLRGVVDKDASMALTTAGNPGPASAGNQSNAVGDPIRAAYNSAPSENGISTLRTDKSARSPTSARSRA